jgi:hypothetical protein
MRDQHQCATETARTGVDMVWNRRGGYAQPASGVDEGRFRVCMQARGYTLTKLGDPPPADHYYSEFYH